ncbi:DivIVA domain-containing protein [Actinomadura sp. DC4]|uniref:DivIVA domain-containing protein n=1 Tax=Actinomadura sp. DC4 TaxID=3055069 RepID=UPI0025B0D597|nr:DivIVA domain-containing protein [Actinomadura sp. DC4]MDN3350984.1 DivIVA domain-containing protein [Actinomadura sp. DC4]
MPLTPADVRNKQFSTTRLRPGYDEEEVDAFLDEVEAELDRLIQENEELRAKLAECLRGKVPAMAAPIVEPKPEMTHMPEPPKPPEPKEPEPVLGGLGMPQQAPPPPPVQVSSPGEDNMDTAARVLALAQQTADQAIADARREADETLGRARREAEEILGKARRQSEQIVSEARARAESLERDAQDRHRQAMGSLVQQREELERMVDDLNAFEREYRSRLKAYLEGQLRELEAGSHGGPFGGPTGTGPQPAQQQQQPVPQHAEVRNGQPAVGPGNTGQNPFPQQQPEPVQHAQHATGGFHTADNPPHDRR